MKANEYNPMKGRRFLDRFQNFFENLESDDPNEILFYILSESIRLVWDELTNIRKREFEIILILYQDSYIVANKTLDEKDQSYQFSRTLARNVMKSNRYLLTEDIKIESQYKSMNSLKNLDIRSILCVPLRYLGRCIGAIYVDSRKVGGFSDKDVKFMEDFSWILSPYIFSIWEFSEKMFQERKEDVKIIGVSPALVAVLKTVDRVAPSDAAILLEGETGTGKELIAHLVHSRSPRRRGPFIPVDCAAIPSNLLETELFGHERGAFTGAYGKKLGKFELANGGTLFLDEIAELDCVLQTKFLRVLEEKKIVRVGGIKEIIVDIRIIAATNRNLKREMEEGRFRKDLYYRLNGVSIHLPPLRERKEDIALFVEYFVNIFGKKAGKSIQVSPEVMDPLVRYPWYGNVRELKNMMERMVLICEGETLQFFDLPYEIRSFSGEKKKLSPRESISGTSQGESAVKFGKTWQAIQGRGLRLMEREVGDQLKVILEEFFEDCKKDESIKSMDDFIAKAEKVFGDSKSTIYNYINKYQLEGKRKELTKTLGKK